MNILNNTLTAYNKLNKKKRNKSKFKIMLQKKQRASIMFCKCPMNQMKFLRKKMLTLEIAATLPRNLKIPIMITKICF